MDLIAQKSSYSERSFEMKPSWDSPSCPEWASYLAMDPDGEWIWHEEKPIQKNYYWVSRGKQELAREENWYETLEERPKQ
jgi:hypothetical protein